MSTRPAHVVCIFGGAVAGAEAAAQLTSRNIRCVVFDMGLLPWGKIELGLPKWHARQRDQEEEIIDTALSHELVRFVPGVKLGRDLSLAEVLGWGFSAVLLAVGAWRDRPLALPGIEELVGRGFYYQNPFVAWFNQYHDPAYQGPSFEIHDDAVVIGGGLASIDVVKILMLETTLRALRERGLAADLFTLEKKGIPRTLEALGITWERLGLRGCTLYYRRRAQDMPLIPVDEEPDSARTVQAARIREKMMDNFRSKYLFRFQPCAIPVERIEENGRLTGLRFRRTEIINGRVCELAGTDFEVRTPLVISSIGSIPEPLPGIPMNREVYRLKDERTGQVEGFENVFALGNAVTGRGNIRASRLHGREVARWLADEFLQWSGQDRQLLEQAAAASAEKQPPLPEDFLKSRRLLSPQEQRAIDERVTWWQRRVGYGGDYRQWVAAHRPVRLEDL
jgi:NADPH-dependent glutamate synthase beta subunit-like oxidoreductase